MQVIIYQIVKASTFKGALFNCVHLKCNYSYILVAFHPESSDVCIRIVIVHTRLDNLNASQEAQSYLNRRPRRSVPNQRPTFWVPQQVDMEPRHSHVK